MAERILVCIGPSPHSASVLTVARRLAEDRRAEWWAVNVETPETLSMSAAARAQITRNLRLAEKLGAETVTLTGERAAPELLRFAREQKVTKIVVGKPRWRRLRDRVVPSLVDELVLASGDIDVLATTGDEHAGEAPIGGCAARSRGGGGSVAAYAAAIATTLAATAIAYALFGRRDLADVVMIYLLGIVIVSSRFGFRPSIAGALLSVIAFDLVFIPPYFELSVADLRHVVTFSVMLVVAIVIASLTQRVRDQIEVARRSERRTAVLYALSRELSRTQALDALVEVARRHAGQVFERDVDIVVRDGGVTVTARVGSLDAEQQRLADAFASQLTLAVERARLTAKSEAAEIEVRAERLRSTLLSSLSHDLRTPLAVMKGVASSLVDDETRLSADVRKDMHVALLEETERLERLVRNLLDMTRLEAGGVRVKKEWHSVQELVGATWSRMEPTLGDRQVTIDVDATVMALVDVVLFEQMLVNLFENAAKHTPRGTRIDVSASESGGEIVLAIADRGPGIPSGEHEAVFEKFHSHGGVGLGLAICRAIATAHGGRIRVLDREGGGARFEIALPLEGLPPETNGLPEVAERGVS